MEKDVEVFGFGSLMNRVSLEETIGAVGKMMPCRLRGYRRVFDIPSEHRSCAHGPTGALNLQRADGIDVYGIVFTVDEDRLPELLTRERAYNVVSVDVEDLEDGKVSSVKTFVGKSPHGTCSFKHDEPEQMAYLDICLSGARDFGDDFYKNFLESTFVEECTLAHVLEREKG